MRNRTGTIITSGSVLVADKSMVEASENNVAVGMRFFGGDSD